MKTLILMSILVAAPALADISPDGKWDCSYDRSSGQELCVPRTPCDPAKDPACKKLMDDRAAVALTHDKAPQDAFTQHADAARAARQAELQKALKAMNKKTDK